MCGNWLKLFRIEQFPGVELKFNTIKMDQFRLFYARKRKRAGEMGVKEEEIVRHQQKYSAFC
jgi:hypothetical protein